MAKKLLISFLIIFILLFLAIGLFIIFQIQQMKPDYSGETPVAGLSSSVKIIWDENGVIHIEGKTVEDVIIASGYATAKERLWQMEMVRRVAKGQLSEIFGETTVDIDRLFLTLNLDSITIRNYQQISAESKEWLQNYATGINAFLKESQNDLPIEFMIMGFKPVPWTAEDCLLQNRLMAWLLNFNWRADFLYWQLASKLPAEKMQEIIPQWKNYPNILPDYSTIKNIQRLTDIHMQLREILNLPSGFWGSNSWAVSPQKMRNGKAWLANDPHLSLQLPSIWIEMHLKSENFEVMGFALPGSPGIIIGRNNFIAWGLTNGMIDDSDLFLEKVDTLENIFWKDNVKLPLHRREHLIRIKDKPDLIYTVYATETGPLVNGIISEMKTSQAITLKWVGAENSDELKTFIGLAFATNWSDFVNALQTYAVPAQNFVYADRQGNIGYHLAGKIPIRSYASGLIALPAWESKYKWTGWIAFDQLPQIYNPVEGFIVTANNQIQDKYPFYLSELWEPPFRALRIRQLLEEKSNLDFQDMKRIQNDGINLFAKEILPILIAELDSVPMRTISMEKIKTLFYGWDYSMDQESIAATIFETIQHFLIKNIFKDELDDKLYGYWLELPNSILRIFLQVFKNQESIWFDNVHTAETETRSMVIRQSIAEGLSWLEKNRGSDLTEWRWGQLHQLKLSHVLGKVALTDRIFNRGSYSVAGSNCTVNVATYRPDLSFAVYVGPSMRFIVDWGSTDWYWSIIPGGNSGHFLSKFYDDQIASWRDGRLKQVNLVPGESSRVIHLLP